MKKVTILVALVLGFVVFSGSVFANDIPKKFKCDLAVSLTEVGNYTDPKTGNTNKLKITCENGIVGILDREAGPGGTITWTAVDGAKFEQVREAGSLGNTYTQRVH